MTKEGRKVAATAPSHDLSAFRALEHPVTAGQGNPDRFSRHVLNSDIVETTDHAYEIRVSECLWAKTFRDLGAAGIGYAVICHADYAYCQGFNPKIRMIRTKTLMEGDDCCNHRWVWEE